jgi:2-polyprenyl-3-methyl-5-hydroxy-6-metoxy-1,4-benzoquinol methylase
MQAQQHFQQQRERSYYEQSPERPLLLSLLRDWLSRRTYDPNQGPRILDVGCGRGWIEQQLRLSFPNAAFDGVEINRQACQEARGTFDNLYEESIEGFLTEQRLHHQYDCIILADILEHLIDPWTILAQLKEGLNRDGHFLVCLPNVGHYSIILSLIHGRWNYMDIGLLDRTHLRFFTLQEALQMFQDTGLIPDDIRFMGSPDPEVIDRMADLATALGADPNRFKQETQAFQYIFWLSPLSPQTETPES